MKWRLESRVHLWSIMLSILVLAGILQASSIVNIGLKHEYANAGDTIWVPVYIANYTAATFDSCSFALTYDASLLTYQKMQNTSGIVYDWKLTPVASANGTIPVALDKGTAIGIGYGDGELVRIKFLVNSGSQCALTLTSGKLFRQDSLFTPTLTSSVFTVGIPFYFYGDVTGNKMVEKSDADTILRNVTGWISIPNNSYPAFTTEVADVSDDNLISAFDAAIVNRHAAGLLSNLPLATADNLGKKITNVTFHLSNPVKVSGNVYDYVLTGTNTSGFLSGEFSITCRPYITNMSITTISVKGAVKKEHFIPGDFEFAIITNDITDTNALSIGLRVQYQSGYTQGYFNFYRCLLNECRMPLYRIFYPAINTSYWPLSGFSEPDSTAIKGQLRDSGSTVSLQQIRQNPGIFSIKYLNKVLISDGNRFLLVEVFDVTGKEVRKGVLSKLRSALSVADLPSGNYIARIYSKSGPQYIRFFKEP